MRRLLILFILFSSFAYSEPLQLRSFLNEAHQGDYIVTARDKNLSLLRVSDRSNQSIHIDEISIPFSRVKHMQHTWRSWFLAGAPYHTSWVTYSIELPSGKVKDVYSHTLKSYCKISEEDNLFTQLLNREFVPLTDKERKRKGSSNDFWNPKMLVDGKEVSGVEFSAWKTHWPTDGSLLSGKQIIIYLPKDSKEYPSYFPYWMQLGGGLAKVQVRIVDSGKNLSP